MEAIQNFPEIAKKDFPLLNKNLKSNEQIIYLDHAATCLLYTSPSPRDPKTSRMPSSA